MAMSNKGLTKLMEECGELIQAAAKKTAFMYGQHPDGKGDLNTRLEEEIADVTAACLFVIEKLALDSKKISARRNIKLVKFREWDADPST